MPRVIAVLWIALLGGCASTEPAPEPPPTTTAEWCKRGALLMGELNHPGQQVMLLEKMRNMGCLN